MDENDARVSDLYATSPPCLKLILTVLVGLSVLSVIESFTSKILDVAISRVADAVEFIARPLIDVAIAAPIVGEVRVGDVKVLFVSTCVSASVTNLFSRDPSHALQ